MRDFIVKNPILAVSISYVAGAASGAVAYAGYNSLWGDGAKLKALGPKTPAAPAPAAPAPAAPAAPTR